MPNPISSVVQFFANPTECKVYRPSNNTTFYSQIHLFTYDAQTARKSSLYDRVGSVPYETDLLPGDVITFESSDDSYIVSTLISDHFFGAVTRKIVNLVYVEDTVTVYRLTETVTNGFKEMTKTIVNAGVNFAYKRYESAESKDMDSIKEVYYGIFSNAYTFNIGDIVSTSFGDYRLLDRVPLEEGLSTWMIAEDRVDAG